MFMTIELSATVERELRDLAMMQSRDVGEVVEEAVRQYLEASAITDLDPGQIAEAQAKLMGELQDFRQMGMCGTSKVEELNRAIKVALDVR